MAQHDTFLKAVQDAHIFQRNKIALETKVLACLLYLAGLSYRVMTLQTGIIIPACYRSVHYWMQKLRGITSKVQVKERRFVPIDETKQKINGWQLFVWSAIDIETKELLAIWASYQRSSFAAFVFVRKVLDTCTNKPVILVDGGPWYPYALERYGVVEMASHHFLPEELHREVLSHIQGEDKEVLQQHQYKEQDYMPLYIPQPLLNLV